MVYNRTSVNFRITAWQWAAVGWNSRSSWAGSSTTKSVGNANCLSLLQLLRFRYANVAEIPISSQYKTVGKERKSPGEIRGQCWPFLHLDYVPCVSVCLKNQFIATRSIMAQWRQVFLVIVFFPTKLIYLPAWQRGCSIKHSPRIIYGIMLLIRWIL